MSEKDTADLKRYAYNLFAYPAGYFEEKSCNDLGISEEVRLMLVDMQKTTSKDASEDKAFDDFLKDFEEEWE